MTGGRGPARTAVVGAMLFALLPGPARAEEPRPVAIASHPIPHFRVSAPADRVFGRLRWIGGMELEPDTVNARGLSGVEVIDQGRRLVAVADDGHMLSATIERDADGRPVGLTGALLETLTSDPPSVLLDEEHVDSEGLDVSGDGEGASVAVSYEWDTLVTTGRLRADGLVGPMRSVPLPPAVRKLPDNQSLEALAVGPEGGPLAGRIVVIAEEPPPGDTDRPGWILGGDEPAEFHVRDDGYAITGADFGPDGDLYVLERTASIFSGFSARIRRIAAADITGGATVDGPEILRANGRDQIDNMEGISVWLDQKGRTVVSLISDDNRSMLQRTVYLEFELLDD